MEEKAYHQIKSKFKTLIELINLLKKSNQFLLLGDELTFWRNLRGKYGDYKILLNNDF